MEEKIEVLEYMGRTSYLIKNNTLKINDIISDNKTNYKVKSEGVTYYSESTGLYGYVYMIDKKIEDFEKHSQLHYYLYKNINKISKQNIQLNNSQRVKLKVVALENAMVLESLNTKLGKKYLIDLDVLSRKSMSEVELKQILKGYIESYVLLQPIENKPLDSLDNILSNADRIYDWLINIKVIV